MKRIKQILAAVVLVVAVAPGVAPADEPPCSVCLEPPEQIWLIGFIDDLIDDYTPPEIRDVTQWVDTVFDDYLEDQDLPI